MKIRDIEVEDVIEEKTTIYRCPYCNKKFLNKNSIYKHIAKNYCYGFDFKFQKLKSLYENKKITYQQYLEQCYEHGCIDYLGISEIEKEKLSEDFYNKIKSLYEYYE